MWGVYETEEFIHVAPCDNKGKLLKSHILEWYCSCNPELYEDKETKRLMLSHRELH